MDEEEEEANLAISSEEEESMIMQHNNNHLGSVSGTSQGGRFNSPYRSTHGFKTSNAVRNYGVMNFEHHMNSEKLGMEESPFIHLTVNSQYIGKDHSNYLYRCALCELLWVCEILGRGQTLINMRRSGF